jgi:alpha-beta hydrolase superfamily lysophospholipase
LTLVVLAACSSGSPAAVPSATATSLAPVPSPTPAQLEPLADRCGSPEESSSVMWFRSGDGTRLDGAEIGSGPVGVVLGHQYPAELCGWWPFAVYLARHGMHVFLFDFRCLGESECTAQGGDGSDVDDMLAAAGELRSRGARRIFLMGASLGGTVAMMAGGRLEPPPAGVVSFSGEADLGYLAGGSTRLDALSAVPRLRAPFLQIMARQDTAVSVADARRLEARAGSPDKRLIVLPAPFGHGWNIVTGGDGSPTSIAPTVLHWVQAHSAG